MKVLFFTKKEDFEDRDIDLAIIERLRDRGIEVEVLDKDEPSGAAVANVYDIYATPSILVTMDNGTVTNSWTGCLPPEADLIVAAEA